MNSAAPKRSFTSFAAASPDDQRFKSAIEEGGRNDSEVRASETILGRQRFISDLENFEVPRFGRNGSHSSEFGADGAYEKITGTHARNFMVNDQSLNS